VYPRLRIAELGPQIQQKKQLKQKKTIITNKIITTTTTIHNTTTSFESHFDRSQKVWSALIL
jgi:hypothetical protein